MQSSLPGGSSFLPAPPPAELQDAVTAMMSAGRVPGLSLAVVDRDGALCAAGFGTADLAGGVPATPGTAYPWFSLTKPVTATAVMALAEAGRLDLQAPLDDYVDFLRAPGTSRPTVEQLLTHTAGLSNPLPIRWVHPAGAHLGLRPFYVDGPAYGGLVGDVHDSGRFLRQHLGDGQIDGRRVLSADAARAMRTIEHPGRPFDHGIGWFRGPGPGSHEWVEHYGTGAGFWNVMRLYPDRGLGIVVMANSTTAYDVGPVLARLAAATWA